MSITRPRGQHGVVDFLVDHIRVQTKALATPASSLLSYRAHLRIYAGTYGSVPQYRACGVDDFDSLVVFIFADGAVAGLFVFPIFQLEQRGYAGERARSLQMTVYPPWARPRRS